MKGYSREAEQSRDDEVMDSWSFCAASSGQEED